MQVGFTRRAKTELGQARGRGGGEGSEQLTPTQLASPTDLPSAGGGGSLRQVGET
jgi:hypothetical protein